MAHAGWRFPMIFLLVLAMILSRSLAGNNIHGSLPPTQPEPEPDCDQTPVRDEISSLRQELDRLLSALQGHLGGELGVSGTSPKGDVPTDCEISCIEVYNPVCGSDGQTYPNLCNYEVAQCKDPTLTSSTEGACPTDPGAIPTDCELGCVAIYAPVCGSDGQTYPSLCDYQVAQCKDSSLTSSTEGACPTVDGGDGPIESPIGGDIGPPDTFNQCPEGFQFADGVKKCVRISCDRPCPAIYKPVCGSDGETYPNACLFEIAQCRDESLTAVEGACPTQECGKPCTREYRPYCGSDGQTYNNYCLFEIALCKDASLTASEGACSECGKPCTREYRPYCGSDGQTYNNYCLFEIALCKDASLTASEGACSGCARVVCDELACPEDVQHTYTGQCCPECPQDWGLDPCEFTGTCDPAPLPECEKPCFLILDPVCGSDGITYPNSCVFEIAQCKNSNLTSTEGACPDDCSSVTCDVLPCPEDVQYTYPGQCCAECPQDWGLDPCELSGTCDRPTPDCERPCILIYSPVCGSDGQTYSNICMFEVAKCKAADDTLTYTEGECPDCSSVTCDVLPCPENLQHTYPGQCCAECPQDWGLDPCELSGTCPTPDCVKPCPKIYRPVCGSDGQTYANPCLFEIALCQNAKLNFTEGACVDCSSVTCDVLPCPEDVQYTYPGQCCAECPQDWGVDPCELSGTCDRPTPDPCEGIACSIPICPTGYSIDYEGEGCCPGCTKDADPCEGIYCDIPNCPEGYVVDYEGEGCCPGCIEDPCFLVVCDVPICEPGMTVDYSIGCCGACVDDPDPCAGIYCGIPNCPEGFVLDYETGCCPSCKEDPCAGMECPTECPLGMKVDTEADGCCIECIDDCSLVQCGIPNCDPGMIVDYSIGCCGACVVDCDNCPVLTCSEDLQHTYEGECCPQCPQDWGLDPCRFTGTCDDPPTSGSQPRDCSEVDDVMSGVYDIFPIPGGEAVSAFCDFDTAHGPWTIIQRRVDGSQNFYQKMRQYQDGFGDLEGEFWFGLDNIYALVSQGTHQLRIDMRDARGISKQATYSNFTISDESDSYRLTSVGKYTGNARDSLSYHVGMQFTTRDVDNDINERKNCARFHKGAWWYRNCLRSNLNGRWRNPAKEHVDGILWVFWKGYTKTVPYVEMKIRRV